MISFQKKNTINETKSWREGPEHIKVIWEHHTNFSVFHFSAGKNMHKDFLADNSQECMKNWLSCHICWEKINAIEKKESVHYLLGLSISSIAARSFCLAFLLIWDPRQTFTRLVSCFVEYSCSGGEKKDPNLICWKTRIWSMQGKNRQILSFQWTVTRHYKSVKSRGNYSLRHRSKLFTQPRTLQDTSKQKGLESLQYGRVIWHAYAFVTFKTTHLMLISETVSIKLLKYTDLSNF